MDMNNTEFAKELEKRTKIFAVNILKLSAKLPNTIEAKVIRNHISKSGTSVGANYREANRSRSKSDFTNRVRICEAKQAKLFTGSKSSRNSNGLKRTNFSKCLMKPMNSLQSFAL